MLVLTRRIGAALSIGDDVQVIVLGTKGNQVRIGIIAPKAISVRREEIYERIKNERELNWAPNNARRKQPLIVNVGARQS